MLNYHEAIVVATMDYLRGFIEGHDPIATKLASRFPFRHLFWHCYRTRCWARRINQDEKGDGEIVELAALFHDAGKCLDNSVEGHALAGAQVCKDYLRTCNFDAEKTETIAEIVRNHIHIKSDSQERLEARILKDADTIDEVGALTVVWDCMAEGASEIQSYCRTCDRIQHSLALAEKRAKEPFCTGKGRRLYAERVAFLREYARQLTWELGEDESLRGVLSRDTLTEPIRKRE